MSVQVFGLYTRGLTMVVARGNQDVVTQVLRVTGGESLGLVVVFLLCLLVGYKARQEVKSGEKSPKFDAVWTMASDLTIGARRIIWEKWQ